MYFITPCLVVSDFYITVVTILQSINAANIFSHPRVFSFRVRGAAAPNSKVRRHAEEGGSDLDQTSPTQAVAEATRSGGHSINTGITVKLSVDKEKAEKIQYCAPFDI